jgi:hypothetical protein
MLSLLDEGHETDLEEYLKRICPINRPIQALVGDNLDQQSSSTLISIDELNRQEETVLKTIRFADRTA